MPWVLSVVSGLFWRPGRVFFFRNVKFKLGTVVLGFFNGLIFKFDYESCYLASDFDFSSFTFN